jgi:hypothetical protein
MSTPTTALAKIKERKERKATATAATASDTTGTTDAANLELNYFRLKRNAQGDVVDVQILQAGFVALLRRLGFRKYDVGESYIIIRVVDNIIEQVQLHQLRGFIVRYFHRLDDDILEQYNCPKELLIEKLHRTLGTLTTDEKLSLLFDLDEKEIITVVEDTIDKAYFFYRNGFVEVTKDTVKLLPYKDLPGCVWKDQILPRDFKKIPWQEWETGTYYHFSNNVADNRTRPDGKPNNPERFNSFMTITGYALHKYFNTKLKMPIFLDARISDDPDGRSGKSLHCKAIRQMLNADPENGNQCIIVDGKTFDPENRFKYEDLHVSTRVFVIDDVRRGLPIELFFNAVVDGFMRERKGEKTKVRIWCKPILTLNYTLAVRGGSAKDRVVEFEFADYYSVTKTPEMEHGCWFFRDWDETEWLKFDNFMLQCVSEYLRAGIIMPDTINLEARKLSDETAPEFIAWMEDLEIQHEKDYDKSELFKQFGQPDEHTGKCTRSGFQFLKQRTFTDWLHWWVQYRPEMAGYREFRSSGKDMIRFFYNEPVSADSLEASGKSVKIKLFTEKASRVVASVSSGEGEGLPF